MCWCASQIDGVSYRGRVMVEVEMTLGNLPTDKHEEIKIQDQKRIAVSLGGREGGGGWRREEEGL